MPLPPLTAAVLTLLCALAEAGPQVSSDVIHRPVKPTAQAPTEAIGFSVRHMDRSVDPRQDFYAYANGNWLKRLQIPDAESDIGGFSMLRANLDDQLQRLAMQASQGQATKGSPAQQVGDFYRAALDMRQRDAAGLQPIQADLDTAARASGPADLARLSLRLQASAGSSPLINLASMPDMKDSSRTLLLLQMGTLQLSQDQYKDPAAQQIRDLYVGYITRVHQQLGDTPDMAAAKARTILAIETELAAPRLTPAQEWDAAFIYNLMTVDEAQALIPAIDLRAMAAAARLTLPDRVQVKDLPGIKAMQRLLASRPAQDVQTWLRWSVLALNADNLGQPWFPLSQDYQRQRDGLAASLPLERQTVQALTTQLYHPLSQLYVQTYFPETTRREITQMVGHIKAEFEPRLRTNPWLDAPTRAAALDKLARIDIQVGYPDEWIDFSAIDIRPNDHLGNVQRLRAFQLRRQLAQLGQPVVVERFASPPYTTPPR
jgi:putative endopeptidase